MEKKKIILDTNFLLIPMQFNKDIFVMLSDHCHYAYELCVVSKTIEELKSLESRKGLKQKDRLAAKIALKLIEHKQLKILKLPEDTLVDIGTADDEIIEFARLHEVIVATQDKALRDTLKKGKVKVLCFRKMQYITEC